MEFKPGDKVYAPEFKDCFGKVNNAVHGLVVANVYSIICIPFPEYHHTRAKCVSIDNPWQYVEANINHFEQEVTPQC